MTTYQRSSRVLRAAELSSALRGALGNVDEGAEALHTRSVRLEKPGLFARLLGSVDPDEEHETALVLGESALRVAVAGKVRGASGFVAPFASLELLSLPRVAGVDHGPSVTMRSPAFGGSEHGLATYTVFFGPEPEVSAFLERVRGRLAG